MSRSVCLTGSLSLESEVECFRLVSEILGSSISRLPDGETGSRSSWIGWQGRNLASNPMLVCDAQSPTSPDGDYGGRAKFVLGDGSEAQRLHFENLGYSDAATSSFHVFNSLKRDGIITPAARLQVSLPTPLAVLTAFIAEHVQYLVEPALEEAFLHEVKN